MLAFFLTVAFVLAAAWAAYWRWSRKIDEETAEGAAIEWAHFRKHDPDFIDGMDEPAFAAVYDRVNRPRFPGYALATVTAFFISLPIIMAVLTGLLAVAEAAGVTPTPVETAERLFIEDGKMVFFKETPAEAALYYARDLGGFYYFFGLLVAWMAIVAFFMRRFHRRRPGYLRDEIIRARQ